MLQDGERTAERAFNTSLSWEAPGFQIPLKDRGAQIHDIREKFGFEQHWGSHGRDQREQERLRHRRPKLRGEAEARQHKMLDDTAGIIARIMEPQAPAALLESWHTAKAAQLSDAEESALVDNMIEVYEALPEGGAAGTALAAVLTKSLGRATLRDLTEKHAVRYKKARLQDFKTLLTGQEIVRETTRKSKPDTVVRNFVRWTLSGDNVVMTSWGKKRARLDGEKIEIPAVSRKRSKPTMWADYCETYQNKRLRLGRSSFYSAMKEITSGQQKNVRAIDYFVGELAHANRERLERLTRDHLGTEAQRLIAEMRAVFQYVKTSYPKRLRSSACPSHDVRFALGVGDDPGQQPVIDTQSAAIFAWFGKLRVQLPAAHRPLVDHAVEERIDRRARAARRRSGRRGRWGRIDRFGHRRVRGGRRTSLGHLSRGGGDATLPVAEEEAAGEDNSEREQPERPAADAAPRRRVPPRGPRRSLDLGRRLLAGRAELADRRVLQSGRCVADAWRRVRCRFLERGLVRGRVRRLDGLVLLVRRLSRGLVAGDRDRLFRVALAEEDEWFFRLGRSYGVVYGCHGA